MSTRADAGYLYKNITTATTAAVKTGTGKLKSVIVNKPVASEAITLYDGTSSGTKIGTITLPGTLLQQGPYGVDFDVQLAAGLTVVKSSTSDITVIYC